MNPLPMLGNLAWAPVPDIENVEVLDRFNGVPTLGIFAARGERTLFWRVAGYVPANFSLWAYATVDEPTAQRLADGDTDDLLTGFLFESPVERFVTIGVTDDSYRLIFEREWQMPRDVPAGDLVHDLAEFLAEALDIALEQDLPASRREMMLNASRAVRQLATR